MDTPKQVPPIVSRRSSLKLLGLGSLATVASGLHSNVLAAPPEASAAQAVAAALPGYYRFTIGAVEAWVISDGLLSLPQSFSELWAVEPESAQQELKANFIPDRAVFQSNPLVIRTGKETVLVDTGNGSADRNSGRLLANLRAAKIAPESITTVIFTHAHGDHIRGLLASPEPNPFPNARLVFSRTEWEWITTLTAKNAPEKIKAYVPQLLEWGQQLQQATKDRLQLVEPGVQFIRGVELIAAPGHTPGHSIVRVSSRDEQMIHLADTTHHQVLSVEHPTWGMNFDTVTEQAIATRLRVLRQLANERTLVLGYHFAWPGLGHIRSNGSHYRWAPSIWDWPAQWG